jgi:hypothetical protein
MTRNGMHFESAADPVKRLGQRLLLLDRALIHPRDDEALPARIAHVTMGRTRPVKLHRKIGVEVD